jgi:hypothetical protein
LAICFGDPGQNVRQGVPFGHRQVTFLPFIDESEKKYRHVDAAKITDGTISAALALALSAESKFRVPPIPGTATLDANPPGPFALIHKTK